MPGDRRRDRLRALRGAHLRLLRDADRLGDRDPRRACAGRWPATASSRPTTSCSSATAGPRRPRNPGPYLRYREVLARCLRRGLPRATASSRPTRPPRPSARPSPTGPRSRIRRPRSPGSRRGSASGVITNCDDDLFAGSNAPTRRRVRLDRHRPVGRQLQAGPAQLHGRVRTPGAATRADPPRRPEPVPRSRRRPSRLGLAVGLDRSPTRPRGFRRDARADATPDATFPDMASFAGGRRRRP